MLSSLITKRLYLSSLQQNFNLAVVQVLIFMNSTSKTSTSTFWRVRLKVRPISRQYSMLCQSKVWYTVKQYTVDSFLSTSH